MSRIDISIPERLVTTCRRSPGGMDWLGRLPGYIDRAITRWSLSTGEPFGGPEMSCSWVAPVKLADGRDAVLKIGMPHMEAEHEIEALQFWNGEPTVPLLDWDDESRAMLMERCLPGTPLKALDEPQQDVVMGEVLRRLRRTPTPPHPFRPLSEMLAHWTAETRAYRDQWLDSGLVEAGFAMIDELLQSENERVLLATDLHADNVLLHGERWRVIDPKPFVGDPAYDGTQHLFNCAERLFHNPEEWIARFADLAGLDHQRLRSWVFARCAAECDDELGSREERLALARRLAP